MDEKNIEAQAGATADAEMAAVDEMVAQAPVGNFSSARIKAAVKAIEGFKSAIGDETPFEVETGDIKDGPLPEMLFLHLAAIAEAIRMFGQYAPEEGIEAYDIGSIVDDESLAIATAVIKDLNSNKEFKKFLRSEVPQDTPAEEPASDEPAPAPTTPEDEVDALADME